MSWHTELSVTSHELAILIAFVQRVVDAGRERPDLLSKEDLAAMNDARTLLIKMKKVAGIPDLRIIKND